MDEEQIENVVLELKRLVNYVQAMKAANYKKALEEASKAWYEERDPAALWALAVLGARETGRGVKVFEDEDDKVAYLIASFVLLSRLKEFVELRDRAYETLEKLERAVESRRFALSDVISDLNVLAEAEKRAREIANELDRIAYRLERAGYSRIAKRLKAATENVFKLAEATYDDLRSVETTRGERAVAALLSLVTSGLFGVSVERALAERGEGMVGTLSVASAVRSAPYGFYIVFISASGEEGLSEGKRLALRIASLLADPRVGTTLISKQNVEVIIEEKTENGKRYIYVLFVDKESRKLLKAVWEAGKRLKPFEEIPGLVEAASSGSKPLIGLDEETWKRVVETVRRAVEAMSKTKEIVKKTARAIAIGALPTDAVLYPGYKHVYGDSSYLSQAFTYWALAEGGIGLERVYPSEEGLKPMWRVDGKYTETVSKILNKGRAVLNELLESGVDLRAALTEIKMNDELRVALEGVAGEFWRRIEELLAQWKQLEGEANKKEGKERVKVIKEINSLGKYLRVLLPLTYAVKAYEKRELSREEAVLAVIFAILYDGIMYRDKIWLAVGGPEHEEKPLMIHNHFTAFWLWALKELGLKPSAVYPDRGAHRIVFKGAELSELLKALAPVLPTLYELRDALTEFADAFKAVTNEVIKAKYGVDWAYDVREEDFFKKLNEIIAMVEDYLRRNTAVEKGPLDTSGNLPKAVIRFKLGAEEVAHINMYWTGEALQAKFVGSRENVEHLASIIRALGGKAEIKRMGNGWGVELTTDGIIAIRHNGWLNAVRSFVEDLREYGKRHGKELINKERYEKIIKDIEAGPNTVKFAGVEFSVYYINSKIEVKYHPGSGISKNTAVSALKARGLEEGKHFTVTTKGVGHYEIRITKETYVKAVETLAQSGLRKGEHYAVYDRRRIIRVKEEHKDAVVNALKAARLEEGKDFAVRSGGQYVIRITYDGLREIQRMALNGDMEAEHFIRDLEGVLSRRYGQAAVNKLIEVLAPAREEGTLDLPLEIRDDKGNIVARIVDLRYEFVKGRRKDKRSAGQQVVSQCAGEDCRLRIIVEYEAGGERKQLKMEWYWNKKLEKKNKTIYYNEMAVITVKDGVEAAVLKTLTGKDVGRGNVQLYASDLNALSQFKALKNAVNKWREGKPNTSSSNTS
nr:PaRep2b protein [Pyrobaculum aerophilum]